MAALCAGIRDDVHCRGEHCARHLSHRRRDQCRLRRQEPAGHHPPRPGDRHAFRDQGNGHLRAVGDDGAHRQQDHCRQPAATVCAAAAAQRRFLFRPPQHGIHRAAHHRGSGSDPGVEPAHHLARTRPPLTYRPCRRDGRPGSGHVGVQHHRHASGDADPAQAGPPHQDDRPPAIHRQYAHSRDLAGRVAGDPHRQGIHARGRDAGALRRPCRQPRAGVRTSGRPSRSVPGH